jgi:hypothetical protein
MPASYAFPSIEKILVKWIKAQTGVHTLTETPANFQSATGPTSGLPLIAVDRISGADLPTSPMLDRPIVDIDCYATTRDGAQTLAEQVRHLLRSTLPGSRIDGVVFGRTRTVVGPRLLPHANPAVRRYSGNYELLLHVQP